MWQAPLVKFIESSGELWLNLKLNLVWSAVAIAGAYFLSYYGAIGVASAQVGAFVVFGALLYLAVSRLRRRLHGTSKI
jgi:hypothetical protein